MLFEMRRFLDDHSTATGEADLPHATLHSFRAGGPNRALVKEFKGIEVMRELTIELVPKVQNPTQGQAPLISTLELIREEAGPR